MPGLSSAAQSSPLLLQLAQPLYPAVQLSEGGKLTAGRCCALQAMELLKYNDLSTGISGWGATDPQVFAVRLAKAMLSRSPPRSYQDGWLWQVLYLFGNFGPLWLTDLVHKVRLRLW